MQRNLSAAALNSANKQQKEPQIKGVKSKIDCRWAGGIPKPIRIIKEDNANNTQNEKGEETNEESKIDDNAEEN
jgi:hypothetical protein